MAEIRTYAVGRDGKGRVRTSSGFAVTASAYQAAARMRSKGYSGVQVVRGTSPASAKRAAGY